MSLSKTVQRVGRTPPTAASLPGQNSVAVGRPARSADTQIGSPCHQRPSPTASRSASLNLPSDASRMVLWTMPWRSGRRPVTIV